MLSKTKKIVRKNKKSVSLSNNLSTHELKVLSRVLLSLRKENQFATPSDIADFKTDTVYFDVDDTLIKYKITKNDKPIAIHQSFIVNHEHHTKVISVAPHKTHINLLKKLACKGKKIVVWSAATAEWAEIVCQALGIDRYVNIYLTKPTAYVDDLNVKEWAKKRIWFKDK